MGRSSVVGRLVRGGIAGGLATVLMDWVTTGVQGGQSQEDADRETAARPNGKSTVDNLVDLVTRRLEVELNDDRRSMAAQIAHYGLGVLPGALYAVLRGRVPLLGAGRGLLFGTLLFLGLDEYAGSALGIAGPPGAYPTSTHVRGFIGHALLGVATDLGLDLTGG